MVSSLPHRSHADIHCWLNFYISSPPCFVCSTRFRSGSSWIHRTHRNHYHIFSNHHILYHLFADDTQGYDRCYVTDIPALLSRLWACVNDLNSLYSSLCLQLNPAKTEFIWFGSRSNLAKIRLRSKYMEDWNQIAPHTRNLHSVPAFRKALNTYLFSEII